MAVIKLRRTACRQCGSTVDLPHSTDKDCLRANAEETRHLLARSRALIEKRARLARKRGEGVASGARRRRK